MSSKPRGDDLNYRLRNELDVMIKDGYLISPISRTALQQRLGLKSRSTLVLIQRAKMIENALIVQLKNAGLDKDGKKRRNTLEEQNEILKQKITSLEKEKAGLIEQLASIVNGLQAKGYNLEDVMLPLRRKMR